MNPKGRYRIQSPVRLRIPAFPESDGDSVLVFLFLQSAWPIRHAFSLPPQIVRKGHHFSAGKMSVEGKEYIVQDGDIMHFRFNV